MKLGGCSVLIFCVALHLRFDNEAFRWQTIYISETAK